MAAKKIHKILIFFTAFVWLVNGLYCKVLNKVPRHQIIVQRILNIDEKNARLLTLLIGIAEIIMAIWIATQYIKKTNAITQIVVIAIMNTLEYLLAPNLLLWGKFNCLFAILFILLIYFNQFYFNNEKSKLTP
jgi:hypothetical protein